MARKLLLALLTTMLGIGTGAALSGCGSGTKTVTASGTPATAQTSASTSTQATATTATTATGTTSTSTVAPAGGTQAPGSTSRTAPEPAFAEQEKATTAAGVSAAAELVRAHGYTPNDTSDYHSDQTLRVLVGTKTGSGDGYDQQAFFFVAGRYIGTDTKQPSASVKVLSQSDTEVTLAYPLYRHTDPLCCPGGGQAHVRFQLNNGKLVALDSIPPYSSTTALSRN
jgi:hypothetical protein